MEPTPTKRFRIALSFAGEKRDFVARVAALLAERFGEDAILYDKYHEAEFARHDLGILLPRLYGEQSDLIVPVLCPDYDAKRWTGWEWLHIYSLLTKEDGKRVMPTRFDYAKPAGLSEAAAFIELVGSKSTRTGGGSVDLRQPRRGPLARGPSQHSRPGLCYPIARHRASIGWGLPFRHRGLPRSRGALAHPGHRKQ